jgi:hypothetical protein
VVAIIIVLVVLVVVILEHKEKEEEVDYSLMQSVIDNIVHSLLEFALKDGRVGHRG